ncbi:hypothetical protein HanPSC8_Chr15g0663111 [Helianthus annuus]|nr:hypothetical protein HanPSC8_Chr15g0663111 [Helianthus annuus]
MTKYSIQTACRIVSIDRILNRSNDQVNTLYRSRIRASVCLVVIRPVSFAWRDGSNFSIGFLRVLVA